ncbi:MFS transporter [Rhodopirellula sallentina]|uniref:MFS transporter n=1 Tax=Rhodopirellula sallentina TaxID=1263869 RepID=UPI0011819A49|nr:MFS transporter [Rhodopirellula sallentina]
MILLPRRAIGVLFCFALLTSAAYVLSSSIGMSLYLARVGSAALPLVLVASAVVVVVVSMLTYVIINLASPRNCIIAIWSLLAASTSALSWELRVSDHSIYVLGLIYVLAEVRGCLNTVFLTTLMTDWFRNSESKRPYTLVASGAPVAGILAGLFLTWGAPVLGNVQMLQGIAALDLVVAVLAWSLPRRPLRTESESRLDEVSDTDSAHANTFDKPESPFPPRRPDDLPAARPITAETETVDPESADRQRLESTQEVGDSAEPDTPLTALRFRSHILVLIVIKTAVLTLIGYQWKVSVSDYWHEDESSLISYFAAYYAIIDTLILTSQLFVAGKFLDRFGIGIALRTYPILLAIVAASAFFIDGSLALVVVFTIARGLDVFRRSFHDPALASAFAMLSKRFRRQSIVIIKGIAKPAAEVISALALFLYATSVTSNDITMLWFGLLIPWFASANEAAKIHRTSNGHAQDNGV